MPTPLDRALNQRVSSPTPPSHIEEKDVSSNAETKKAPLFAFGAIVTGIAAWTIWGSDIFPSTDPSGGTFSVYFFLVQVIILEMLLVSYIYTSFFRLRVCFVGT